MKPIMRDEGKGHGWELWYRAWDGSTITPAGGGAPARQATGVRQTARQLGRSSHTTACLWPSSSAVKVWGIPHQAAAHSEPSTQPTA